MGTFKEKILIINAEKPELKTEIECVVDSGATYTWIPSKILRKLGYKPEYKQEFKIADGSIITRDACWIKIFLKDSIRPTLAVFGDENSEALLGAFTLEGFCLAVDNVNKNLIPVPALLLSFLKKKIRVI